MNNRDTIYGCMTQNEKTVGEFLKTIGVWWEFERAVYLLDDGGRPRVWTPDFYLPELGIYIEVMGPNGNYDYRKKVYHQNRIPIIFVDPLKDEYWGHYIKDQLWVIHNERYNLIKELQSNFKAARF